MTNFFLFVALLIGVAAGAPLASDESIPVNKAEENPRECCGHLTKDNNAAVMSNSPQDLPVSNKDKAPHDVPRSVNSIDVTKECCARVEQARKTLQMPNPNDEVCCRSLAMKDVPKTRRYVKIDIAKKDYQKKDNELKLKTKEGVEIGKVESKATSLTPAEAATVAKVHPALATGLSAPINADSIAKVMKAEESKPSDAQQVNKNSSMQPKKSDPTFIQEVIVALAPETSKECCGHINDPNVASLTENSDSNKEPQNKILTARSLSDNKTKSQCCGHLDVATLTNKNENVNLKEDEKIQTCCGHLNSKDNQAIKEEEDCCGHVEPKFPVARNIKPENKANEASVVTALKSDLENVQSNNKECCGHLEDESKADKRDRRSQEKGCCGHVEKPQDVAVPSTKNDVKLKPDISKTENAEAPKNRRSPKFYAINKRKYESSYSKEVAKLHF